MLERSGWRKQRVWVVVAAAVEEQMDHRNSILQRHQSYHQRKMSKRQGIALAEKQTRRKHSKKIEVAVLEQVWVQMRTKTRWTASSLT